MGEDGTPCGKSASAEVAEEAVLSLAAKADPAGSRIAPLKLKSTKQAKSSIKLAWTKPAGTASYVVYGSACKKSSKMERLSTAAGKSLTVKKMAGKKLKKGAYYKFVVIALDGDNTVVSTSKAVYVATKGGKAGNHKKVTVKKSVLKKAKKLKAGKKLKLKAKAVAANKKLKVKKQVAVRYESTNEEVATVSAKGIVKAQAKGSCYVYAYAQNGAVKKVKVKVK